MGKTAPCALYVPYQNELYKFTSLETSDENGEQNGSVRLIIYRY